MCRPRVLRRVQTIKIPQVETRRGGGGRELSPRDTNSINSSLFDWRLNFDKCGNILHEISVLSTLMLAWLNDEYLDDKSTKLC